MINSHTLLTPSTFGLGLYDCMFIIDYPIKVDLTTVFPKEDLNPSFTQFYIRHIEMQEYIWLTWLKLYMYIHVFIY